MLAYKFTTFKMSVERSEAGIVSHGLGFVAGLDARITAERLSRQEPTAGLQAPVDWHQILVLVVEGLHLV